MATLTNHVHATEADRRQALVLSRVFHCLTYDELQRLIALASVRTHEPGDIIISDGDDGEEIFVIATGAAAVFKNGLHLSYLRTGDIVGEMAWITGQSRSATVVMAERGEVLRLPKEVYLDLIDHHPEMWQDLCQIVSRRLCETTALQSAHATVSKAAT